MFIATITEKSSKIASTKKFNTLEECNLWISSYSDEEYDKSFIDLEILLKLEKLRDERSIILPQIDILIFKLQDEARITGSDLNEEIIELSHYRQYLRDITAMSPLPEKVLTFEEWNA